MKKAKKSKKLLELIVVVILVIIGIVLIFLSYNSPKENSNENPIPIITSVKEPIVNSNLVKNCRDNDGGRNYFFASNVIADEKFLTDKCIDDKKVLEYYCDRDGDSVEVKSTVYSCPYKCVRNACLE